MRIYTRIEWQWNDVSGRYEILRSEAFDYTGPIALCGPGAAGAGAAAGKGAAAAPAALGTGITAGAITESAIGLGSGLVAGAPAVGAMGAGALGTGLSLTAAEAATALGAGALAATAAGGATAAGTAPSFLDTMKSVATVLSPVSSIISAASGIGAARRMNSLAQPAVPAPVTMPTAGGPNTLAAQNASFAEQLMRRGRAATILTQPSSEKLGAD